MKIYQLEFPPASSSASSVNAREILDSEAWSSSDLSIDDIYIKSRDEMYGVLYDRSVNNGKFYLMTINTASDLF